MLRRPVSAGASWALALALFSSSGIAETIMGKVVAVADGDTLIVLDHNHVQHKIRLAGIDAPEKKQSFWPTLERVSG